MCIAFLNRRELQRRQLLDSGLLRLTLGKTVESGFKILLLPAVINRPEILVENFLDICSQDLHKGNDQRDSRQAISEVIVMNTREKSGRTTSGTDLTALEAGSQSVSTR